MLKNGGKCRFLTIFDFEGCTYCDFSELVWPIEMCHTSKFAQLNLETFLFNDPMPKNAGKCRFLPIFDFEECTYCDFSELVWTIETCCTSKFAQLNLETFLFNDPIPKKIAGWNTSHILVLQIPYHFSAFFGMGSFNKKVSKFNYANFGVRHAWIDETSSENQNQKSSKISIFRRFSAWGH